jgi:methylaspartate ammonia-lyase
VREKGQTLTLPHGNLNLGDGNPERAGIIAVLTAFVFDWLEERKIQLEATSFQPEVNVDLIGNCPYNGMGGIWC